LLLSFWLVSVLVVTVLVVLDGIGKIG